MGPAPRKSRIDRLIDDWEPQLNRAFRESVYRMRDGAQLDQIVRSLERGDVDGAVRAVGLDPAMWRPFDRTLSSTFEAGGDATAILFPQVELRDGTTANFLFNIRNPAAEDWLRTHSAGRVSAIIADQEQMIRDQLGYDLEQGLNPRTAALDLVGRVDAATGRREDAIIGLASSQAEWLRNYEEALKSDDPTDALDYALRDARFDAAVRRAAEGDAPIGADLLDKMATAYENRALRYRGEAIARSETIAALHEAQQQSVDQAVDFGVDPEAVKYVWHSTHDSRVRFSHAVIDGQTVSHGEMFISGLGNELEYPGDPSAPAEDVINCRCWREVLVEHLRGVQ